MNNEYTYQEAYQNYLAIRLHFSSKYDFFKYNGKVKTKKQLTEPQKYIFKRLSKRFDKNLIISYFAIRFYENPKFWIFSESSDAIVRDLTELQSKLESFDYNLKQELNTLFEEGTNGTKEATDVKNTIFFTDNFTDFPYLYRRFIGNMVSLSTILVLDDTLNIFKNWSKYLKDDLIFKDKMITFNNLKPFLRFYVKKDKDKYRTLIKDLIL